MKDLKEANEKILELVMASMKNDPDELSEDEKETIEALMAVNAAVSFILKICGPYNKDREAVKSCRDATLRAIHEKVIKSETDGKEKK